MAWGVLGQSLTGTAHRARNTPCQDAHRFSTFGPAGDWLVLAVADGAGGAAHAAVGARVACEELVRLVQDADPTTLLTRDAAVNLFREARAAVLAACDGLRARPEELACTALAAVVGPESAAFAQLGDGAVVVGQGPGYRAAFWPDAGEYANTTDFLTDESFAERLRFATLTHPIAEVAAFTDGLQRLALNFSVRRPHLGFFQPLFRALRATAAPADLAEPLREFLDSDRVNQRTDDDKTLVLAVRRP
jgi:hypothetical protein